MKPESRSSVKAGVIGAAILFFIALAFGYYFFMYRDQMGIIGGLTVPGYALAFIVAGVLAVDFSENKIGSAHKALAAGFLSGCVTAIILVVAWIVLSTTVLIYLDFKAWIGLTLTMAIPIVIGIAISALASTIYAYIDNNFSTPKV